MMSERYTFSFLFNFLSFYLCRNKKHVVVNNKTLVPYDHLILCTGIQYMVPMPTGADISKLVTSAEVPNSPDQSFSGVPPKNSFTVNDAYDAAVALYWAEHNLLNSTSRSPFIFLTISAHINF